MRTAIHYDLEGLLKCTKCKDFKPESEFYNNHTLPGRNYKSSHCKACQDIRNSTRIFVKRTGEDLDQFLYSLYYSCSGRSKRSRQKGRNMEFSLTKEDLYTLYLKQNGKCALTDISMTYLLGEGKISTNISVDRIDSLKGYTLDNIRLVCYQVNVLKSNLSDEELIYFCTQILEKRLK